MRKVNLNRLDPQEDPADPPGFKARMARFGPDLGATATGTSLYEIPPGEAICPYHYEYGEEEWLMVLEGTPSLRTPEGTETLEPMDVVFFAPGPDGAHRVDNHGDSPVRVLMWSQVVYPGCTVYPDSDKIGIWPAKGSPDVTIVRRSSSVDYFDGETG